MLESVACETYPSTFTRRKLLNNSNKIRVFDLRNGVEYRSSRYNKVALDGFPTVYGGLFRSKELMKNDKSKRFGYYSSLINSALFNFAESQFKKYLDYSSDRYIIFKNSFSNRRISVPLENRFSNSYSNKIKKRVSWLCHRYSNNNCVLVTLTFNPEKWYNDKYDMWMSAKKELNRFLCGVRRYFDYHSLVIPDYFCCIEAMKGRPDNNFIGKGLPHFHILFFNCSRLMDWRKIKKLWNNGFIWINRSSDRKKIRKPIDYVAKYVTKTFCKSDESNLLVQSLVWLFGVRSYSCSRKLGLYPLNSPFHSDIWKPEFIVSCGSDYEKEDLEYMFYLLGAG